MNEPVASKPGSQEQEAPTAVRPAEPVHLDLEVAKLTDVGRARPHNEDYVDYYIPPDPRQLAAKGAIYLVADGMGGHQAGEVASQGAVELAIGEYYSDASHDVGTSLVRAFRAANQQIYAQAQADPSKGGMGTTLVAAVILGNKVYIANIGDSRAYLINGQGITRITEDHSWVEEQVRAGLLTEEQARRHPQRNLVTRALGSKPDVQADLFEGQLNPGDSLLLCSDGLTGRVQDKELAAFVQQYPPQEAARRLVALANERGGNDNITVLIVSAREEAATVKAPVAAPIVKRKTRRSPLVPILGGLAALLVLALGGLLAIKVVLPALQGTPTPTPTFTLAASPIPTLEETLTPEVQPPLTVTVALTITATVSPSVEVSPTATLAPTATLTVKPSDTPSLPTATLTPTSTPEPARPSPTLREPTPNAELRGSVAFKWDYPPRQLGLGNAFEVRIWRAGTDAHLGAAAPGRELEQTIDLDALLVDRGGPGDYFWTVVVVRKSTGEELSPEAEARPFKYLGPQPSGGGEPNPEPSQPAPPSGPPPSATAGVKP